MSDVRVSRGVKRLPLMLAAGLLGAALSAAQAQPDPVHAFDWPRQPLHDALQRYSELTGDSVLYDAGHVADKTAPALSGRYSARDALQKLLAGSGLQAIYTTPRALMLRPLPAPKAAPDAARLRYYGQLQARVLSALCARPALRVGEYRAALRITLDAAHAIDNVQVHADHPDMEPGLRRALAGLPMGEPPPGFGLPATLLILPSANGREACAR